MEYRRYLENAARQLRSHTLVAASAFYIGSLVSTWSFLRRRSTALFWCCYGFQVYMASVCFRSGWSRNGRHDCWYSRWRPSHRRSGNDGAGYGLLFFTESRSRWVRLQEVEGRLGGGVSVNNRVTRRASVAGERKETHALTFLFFSPPLTNLRRQRAPPKNPWGVRASRHDRTQHKPGSCQLCWREPGSAGMGALRGKPQVSPVRMGRRVAKLAAGGKAFPPETKARLEVKVDLS
jgi:hypothetical protein